MKDRMPDFTPDWPHGHVTRDGRKAEILRTLDNGCHAVVVENNDGTQLSFTTGIGNRYLNMHLDSVLDIFNAQPPKRVWNVVAWEYSDGSVGFRDPKQKSILPGKIIGRYTLTEGEGMEENTQAETINKAADPTFEVLSLAARHAVAQALMDDQERRFEHEEQKP